MKIQRANGTHDRGNQLTFPMVLQYVINSDLGALSSWFESEIELFLSQRSLENGSAIVAITIWKRLSSDGSDHSTDNDL